MNNKLEQIILDLKKEYQQDEYHNSDKNIDDIDKNLIINQANIVSNEILKVFFEDGEPPLKITGLMTNLGFDLFKNDKFPQRELSGLLALNLKEKLAGKYSDKVILVVADRFYPSSKTCSECGFIKKDLKLKDRVYRCPHCGAVIDRDLNASLNLSMYKLA